jgi:hypothetical protein
VKSHYFRDNTLEYSLGLSWGFQFCLGSQKTHSTVSEKLEVAIFTILYFDLLSSLNLPGKMLWGKTSKPAVASNQINVAWNDLLWRHIYKI